MQKCVKKAGFQSIGATIGTRLDSRCLQHVGILSKLYKLICKGTF